MHIERLLDKINEANETYETYAHESAKYRARHYGFGVSFGNRKLNDEELYIRYLYDSDREETYTMQGIFEVLDFDRDQIKRAYIAARAIKRWYNDTNWERCPSDLLLSRLNNFVIAGKL